MVCIFSVSDSLADRYCMACFISLNTFCQQMLLRISRTFTLLFFKKISSEFLSDVILSSIQALKQKYPPGEIAETNSQKRAGGAHNTLLKINKTPNLHSLFNKL